MQKLKLNLLDCNQSRTMVVAMVIVHTKVYSVVEVESKLKA